MDFKGFCLTETWLNGLSIHISDIFHMSSSHRESSSKSKGGAVLTAVSSKFHACKGRYDLQFYYEWALHRTASIY